MYTYIYIYIYIYILCSLNCDLNAAQPHRCARTDAHDPKAAQREHATTTSTGSDEDSNAMSSMSSFQATLTLNP